MEDIDTDSQTQRFIRYSLPNFPERPLTLGLSRLSFEIWKFENLLPHCHPFIFTHLRATLVALLRLLDALALVAPRPPCLLLPLLTLTYYAGQTPSSAFLCLLGQSQSRLPPANTPRFATPDGGAHEFENEQ